MAFCVNLSFLVAITLSRASLLKNMSFLKILGGRYRSQKLIRRRLSHKKFRQRFVVSFGVLQMTKESVFTLYTNDPRDLYALNTIVYKFHFLLSFQKYMQPSKPCPYILMA